MRIPVISIGNSKGLRLPKTIIELCGFGHEVELEVYSNTLIIRPVNSHKHGPKHKLGHGPKHHGPKHGPKHKPPHHEHEGHPPPPHHEEEYEETPRDPIYDVVDQHDQEDWD